jgi:hypothetical protein
MQDKTSFNYQVSRLAGNVMLWTTAVLTLAMLPTAAHAQELTSFSDGVGKHVVFVANDYHVHELRCSAICWSSNWVNEDLTAMTGGPPLLSFPYYGIPRLTSFSDAAGEHVFYRDATFGHLNQYLFAGGVWRNQDLGVSASSWGTSGYSNGGVERLFYLTSDQHVHMLVSQNGLSWSDSDLTRQTGGTLAAGFTALTSFHDTLGEHVFYVGGNGDLYQLYGYWYERPFCTGFPTPLCSLRWLLGWVNQDLGVRPYQYFQLTSFGDGTGEHVFYTFYDASWVLHVHEHYNPSSGSGWLDYDWGTAYASNPYRSGLTSFSNFGEKLFSVGPDMHVYQLSGINGMLWDSLDLTFQANGPHVSTTCAALISSFTDSSAGWQGEDVFYAANDGDLHHLSTVAHYTGLLNGYLTVLYAWSDNNLTNGSHQPIWGGRCN